MASDQRDSIWEKTYELFYESSYYELLSERMISKWKTTDDVTKVLVALTTTGSAVAGWVLWQSSVGLNYAWATIAGLGSLMSIVHAALAVPERIKDWEDFRRASISLRIDVETFKNWMEIHPNFSIDEGSDKYMCYRTKYGELIPKEKSDFLKSTKLRQNTQQQINNKLNLS